MVAYYIRNMIAFLHCYYAYLSITITSKLSALNHNKILYYCKCHAMISSSIRPETRHLGAAKRARTIRAQNKKGAGKKGAEQKGRRAKRTQNKKGARSRCCVTITFKVVISSDNRVLSQSFFFFL